eukprot:maker-scaffold_15-snap-gene-1.31-mRNA-1 protein AED:0.11 eAED:0.11 QI:200/1/0.5/1/0/0/2/0/552
MREFARAFNQKFSSLTQALLECPVVRERHLAAQRRVPSKEVNQVFVEYLSLGSVSYDDHYHAQIKHYGPNIVSYPDEHYENLMNNEFELDPIAYYAEHVLGVFSFLLNRGDFIEVYVAFATSCYYFVNGICRDCIVWVNTVNGTIPLGRMFGWLLTCPGIVMQLMNLHGAAGIKKFADQEKFLVILEQVMITLGSFSAVSTGTLKWLFFVLAAAVGTMFFFYVYYIYTENRENFPEDVKLPLALLTFFFFFSWFSYPLTFVAGPAGLKILEPTVDTLVSTGLDVFSKLLFPFSCWYVRWFYLGNERVINTGKILKSRRMKGEGNENKIMLSSEEVEIAKKLRYTLLVVSRNVLVHKTMIVMMKDFPVDFNFAFDCDHAMHHLQTKPSYLYDCVLVTPETHTTDHIKAKFKKLSEFVVGPPYKLPMLGMYFGVERSTTDPGDYVHGILRRSLEQNCVFEDLYHWRLLANMWRRLSLILETIEGDDVDVFRFNEFDLDTKEKKDTDTTLGLNRSESKVLKRRKRGSLFGKTMLKQQGKVYNIEKSLDTYSIQIG